MLRSSKTRRVRAAIAGLKNFRHRAWRFRQIMVSNLAARRADFLSRNSEHGLAVFDHLNFFWKISFIIRSESINEKRIRPGIHFTLEFAVFAFVELTD